MRLIEVADLEKFIQENVCAIGNDHLLLVAGNDGRWHEALPLVKTAYSVDRVVEELESELKKGNIAIDFGEFRLFEIVKQCDVSDYVCEWKLDGDNLTTGCGDYFNLYDNCTGKFKYCPRCGKRIKVKAAE